MFFYYQITLEKYLAKQATKIMVVFKLLLYLSAPNFPLAFVVLFLT